MKGNKNMNQFKLIKPIIIFSLWGLLVGCNTVQGVGKDVQHGGKVIQNAASCPNCQKKPKTVRYKRKSSY